MEMTFTDANFEAEVLQSRIPVMVDFWATWCGPCLMAGPIIEELAKELEGKVKVGKMNVDENPDTPLKFNIMSIPTVIVFKGGKEVGRQVGFSGKEGYINMIDGAINPKS
jgi:thioredoxin 1